MFERIRARLFWYAVIELVVFFGHWLLDYLMRVIPMRTMFYALFLAVFAAPVGAQPKDDLSGYYSCRGQEGEKKYSGVVVIEANEDDVRYLVSWYGSHSKAISGVGIRTGESFACAWAMDASKGQDKELWRGINVYKIEPKRLVGHWASFPGNGELNSETLTFIRAIDKDDDASFCSTPPVAVAPKTPSIRLRPPLPPHVKDVSGMTNYGLVSQNGDRLSIDGNQFWSATGHFRLDGLVEVYWLENNSGRQATGLYEWRDGELQGRWGFDAAFDEFGEIEGTVGIDAIRRVEPVKE